MGANIIIPSEISKEYFKVVDFEDANQRQTKGTVLSVCKIVSN